MYFISTLFLFIIALLSLAESSSPAEFMESINGYRSACKKLGWEPKQGCTSVGHVIAFHAAIKFRLRNVPVNTIIKFEDVLLNKGNGYDPKTGVFTAPEEGVYFFEWTFISTRKSTVYVEAVVDGARKASTCVNDQQSYHVSTSGHLLYELKKGNKVWIRTFYVKAGYMHADKYTYFSGYKITLTTVLLVLHTTFSVSESLTPSKFIKDFNGYMSVCQRAGWEPRKGCSPVGHVIAFHAAIKSRLRNVPVNTIIKFEDVLLNNGNGYDPKTGVFTAPEDGVYFFQWTFISTRKSTVFLETMVDGVRKVSTCVQDQQSNHVSTSGHLLYELKKGNKVFKFSFSLLKGLLPLQISKADSKLQRASAKERMMWTPLVPTFLILLITLSIVRASSPDEFMGDMNGYRSACKKLGWEPMRDCTANHVIAFHANIKSHLNDVPINTTIKFNNVQLNKGEAYDPETGIFTAPEEGVYSFAWSFLSKQGGTVYIAATVNKIDRAHTCIGIQQSQYISTSGNLIFELMKGNKVWIRVWHIPATFIHGGYYTYFSVSKINSF
ncbi:uncharacterized protein LOC133195106 [Saccostrea echinata]|uniref:uncharacterized protein LOC133195106 n=1 Tax=Saccostrea echinata TaxID=191078 RepID=UPI002A8065B4|nr:uncharacterized protein LOC133195106 [Saccostrea echinata]